MNMSTRLVNQILVEKSDDLVLKVDPNRRENELNVPSVIFALATHLEEMLL